MIDFADKADFVVDPGYYRGRWGYFSAAADFMRSIPGVQSWVPSDVLEVGAYKVPLVVDCDTLDVRTWIEEPTYQHDAGVVPWPVADKAYRAVVALQVWEHLAGRQREAWHEVRRVVDWAILSLPHLWPAAMGQDHAGIGLPEIHQWTGSPPSATQLVRSSVAPLDRIVCLYDLRA